MSEQHKFVMANLEKHHEEALEKYKLNTMQNFHDYLLDKKSNILLHAQVIDDPFNACKVNFDALSLFKSAYLDFDICFPSRVAWEEFVEEWKNFSRLYLTDTTVETSDAPVTGCEGNDNEEVEEEDIANPNKTSVNS
ncbi:hypothetical protein PVK06_023409 [Gossypium arboreum]|uniref:Uncharacterized protein n=1 Tax=Gossypium arboreum TaxID=29729 RepID=A0ABR0PBC4_GOSAR|nr:hypothetical protein PVK06_023409 [Gossypium arboreum]